jgi:hypothetical protein
VPGGQSGQPGTDRIREQTMTYPRIAPATDPDAADQAPIGTVLIRYPNLSGALVTVAVADYPHGGGVISPSPTENRYAECAGCGERYGSLVRGCKDADVRTWALGHCETCRALPPAGDAPDYAALAHDYAAKALMHLEAQRASRIPAVELPEAPHTAQLYMRAAELYARLAGTR